MKPLTKKKKIAIIVCAVLVALLGIAYGVGAFYFSSHFYPNTKMGEQDLSFESTEDFAEEVAAAALDYSLDVEGDGFSLKVAKADAAIEYDANQSAENANALQNCFAWPIEIFQAHDVSEAISVTYDEAALKALTDAAVSTFNATATPSTNAALVYDEEEGSCAVKPETQGTQIDATALLEKMEACIKALNEACEVTEDELIKPTLFSTDERFDAAVEKANAICGGEVELTLNGEISAGTITKDMIVSWLTLDDNLTPTLDSAKVQAWADEEAAALDTVGSTRTYTRADGKVITVSGGSFGWEVDTTGLAETVINQISSANFATIDLPTTQTADVVAGAGKRDWGAYVDIDLTEQVLRYYDASDNLLYSCDIVSGNPSTGHATPEGVYYLRLKQSPCKLVGRENGEIIYETTVTYWMPFIRNSIGLHDATWQSSFGGSRYLSYGSHGCINLSLSDSKWFYENLPVNTCIITHS